MLRGVMCIFWLVWVYFGRRERAAASPAWLTVRLPSFMQFSWRCSGVPWMIAGGADRIQSGSFPNPNPLEYGGPGPEWKGAVSCWDVESGLKVMDRRGGGGRLACGMAQNELLASFCSSASQWEQSLEGQITRTQAKLTQNSTKIVSECQRKQNVVR